MMVNDREKPKYKVGDRVWFFISPLAIHSGIIRRIRYNVDGWFRYIGETGERDKPNFYLREHNVFKEEADAKRALIREVLAM